MSLFLISFFLVYGILHVYVFLRVKAAFGFGVITGLPILVVMAIMVIAPVIVRLSEKAGFEAFARILSYVGYLWLALIFLFVSASLVIDLYRLIVHAADLLLNTNLSSLQIMPRTAFFIPLALSVGISFYGYFEALNIHSEHIEIRTRKLPEQLSRFRIVQISDVHLGLIVREDRLQKILHAVRQAKPDMLVSTGDLVDGQIDNLSGLSDLLNDINPPFGKYAITGNHEFYAGLDQALDFTKKAGFVILRGEGRSVSGIINIAGVDDITGTNYGQTRQGSEEELLSGLPLGPFNLLLKHRPIIENKSRGLFDLQLSGHTHKGQIFPFSLITKLYYPVDAGCLHPVNGCFMYVSRGSGTWGPPIRFLAPPEVTVIDLVRDL